MVTPNDVTENMSVGKIWNQKGSIVVLLLGRAGEPLPQALPEATLPKGKGITEIKVSEGVLRYLYAFRQINIWNHSG